MTALASLGRARVRRVDAPTESVLCLTVDTALGPRCLALDFGPTSPGLYLLTERPRGRAATPTVTKIRHHLVGAAVATLAAPSQATRCLAFEREGRTAELEAKFSASEGALSLTVGGHAVVRLTARGAPTPPTWPGDDLEAWAEASARWAERAPVAALETVRTEALAQLRRERRVLERRLAAVSADLARMNEAPTLRLEASLLLAHPNAVAGPGGALTLTDWTTDPPVERAVRVDPRLGVRAQAERWFATARRLDRGRALALTRRAETVAALDALAEREAQVLAGGSVEEVSGAPAGKAAPAPGTAKRVPYRAFVGSGGRPILVGRGARDNDALTLHVARPHDLWLHARGTAGAHVVVPTDRGQPAPDPLVIDAAHLAAHFSDQRGEPVVDVQIAERRHLRKPKGSAPGAVRVDRERVIALRIEPARLAALLTTEAKNP